MTETITRPARPVAAPSGTGARYWPQLDGLRALAVLSVMLHHFIPHGTSLNRFLPYGEIGVRLFFVLSGFLITGILLRSRGVIEAKQRRLGDELQRFYMRRSLRIFPIYYLTIGVAALVGFGVAREAFPWMATYLTNFYFGFQNSWFGPISHLWSLAVEEQFYLVWPWLILLMPRRWLLPSIAATTALGTVTALLAAQLGWNEVWRIAFPLLCLDSLGGGALLAYFAHYPSATFRRLKGWLWLAGPLFLVSLAFAGWPLVTALWATLMSVFFVWLIDRATQGHVRLPDRLLEARPLVYIGKISYGLYLFHNFIPYIVQRLLLTEVTPGARLTGLAILDGPLLSGLAGVVALVRAVFRNSQPTVSSTAIRPSTGWYELDFIIYALLSLSLAAISWRFIEAPINRLKDRSAR